MDQLGRADDAAAAYDRYLKEAPAHEGAPKARAYLFVVLRKIGETKLGAGDAVAARDAFARANALEVAAASRAAGAGVAVLVGLGDALVRLGEQAAAKHAYQRALAAAATDAERATAEKRLEALAAAGARGGSSRRPGSRAVVLVVVAVGGTLVLAGIGIAVSVLAGVAGRPDTDLGWMEARY